MEQIIIEQPEDNLTPLEKALARQATAGIKGEPPLTPAEQELIRAENLRLLELNRSKTPQQITQDRRGRF